MAGEGRLTPSVSVVVPVLNAARTLPSCLAALDRLDPGPTEILLVDNGSTDGSLELMQKFTDGGRHARRRLLHEQRRGASVSRNTGLRAARGDIVAFTDADCAPEMDWLAQLVQPLADPSVGAAAGRVVGSGRTVTEQFCALYTFQTPSY